mgnify:CR=1 FL=1
MRNKLLVAGTLALAMTCTTVFSSITPAVVKAASVSTVQTQTAENSDDYVYCYAGLTWAEYWKAEGVMAAGDTTSSDTADSHDEKDKGAFDAVTRATTNHGLHRGSYQCTAVIKTAEGEYSVSHWSSDGKTVYFTDGTSAGWNRGTLTLTDGTTQTMTEYDVLGLKYVPVKVKSSDYASFKEKYSVVENNGTLIGGYGEKNLQDYNVTASVDKDTNGLKTAEKQSDGSFTFTQRSNGSSSGIKDKTLKTADLNNMGATVKDASGSYGEFLRVDFTKNYGDLGANMQAVKWTYYGNDSTRSKALATYGTKFAADNWMHKSMGIQLGLTNSIRCQLPKGYDGTGYWSLTIYALGYADSTYNFEATDANIVKPDTNAGDTTELNKLVSSVEGLNPSDYTEKSWNSFETELKEAKDILAKEAPNQAEVDEAIKHLTDAKNALDKYVYGTANLSYADFYYGELNDVEEDAEINLDAEDKAASYRESGMYDAVSSATTNKYKSFFSSTYSEDNTNGQGGSIIGMKDVNIAVPTSLYENAKKAISDKKECSNKLLEIISSMKLSDTTPSEYKILNGDGTLTSMKSDVTEDTSDTLTIKTQSSYGQYEVDPVTSENSPLSKLSAKDSLLGIIVEDKDGNKYGMEHLENIWVGGKFAFAVTDGFKEKHGNTIDYKRHESLQGKTIKKVTYLVKDGADIVINTALKCKTLAGSDSIIKATANDNFKDGATVSVDTTAVPSGSTYTLSSVSMGKTVLTEGTDYTYAKNTLTIKATDHTGAGSYSMVFTDDTYSDIVASFTLESGYKTGDISINKNNQITLPAGVSFEKYVNNITSIKINEVEKTGKGGIKATDLFDADGNINFNAAIKGKDGSSTPVFADKSASYTIELTSTGYPSVSGTVQLNTSILEASIKKAAALDSSKYTAETWKSLQTALTEAKEAKSANTQTIVDAANTKLTEALSGLKEKTVTPSKPATEKKNNTTPSTTEKKNNTTPALKKANVKLSKPVLKVGKTTKNKAKVTWKKVKKATGYEIQYTTKGFGNKKATKTIKVSKAKITSAQLKKLKKKTRYKVRIRAVYTEAGYQTATSKWSAIKTVKTK